LKSRPDQTKKKVRVDIIKKARLLREGKEWFAYNIISGMRVAAANTQEDCEIRAIKNGFEVIT